MKSDSNKINFFLELLIKSLSHHKFLNNIFAVIYFQLSQNWSQKDMKYYSEITGTRYSQKRWGVGRAKRRGGERRVGCEGGGTIGAGA